MGKVVEFVGKAWSLAWRLAPPLAAAVFVSGAALGQGALTDCRFQIVGSAKIASVSESGSFVLDDGREARLAGLDLPAGYASGQSALRKLLADRPVVLKKLGLETDRYGRLLVYAFTSENGAERSLQQALLAGGFARVAANIGDKPCASALLKEEARARKAGTGLWSEAAYQPRPADKPSDLLEEIGRFALVEGKVLSVRDNAGTIYLNFGRRWIESFTVTISKRNESTFTKAGLEPKKLEGRRIRVRGFLELRGGPVIEATRPEQIELTELN